MEPKYVRDVLLSLDKVPKVHQDATLREAVKALEVARDQRPGGRLPFRVVLVMNDRGEVVGKVGHLAFLRAMEPGYESRNDRDSMHRSHVDPDLVESMSAHLRLLQPGFPNCCFRAAHLRVADIMQAPLETIDENLPLMSAVSIFVRSQTLSVLVRRGDQIVGLLRMADVFDVIADNISSEECATALQKGDE